MQGKKENSICDYWVLDYDLEKAKKQFGRDVKPMLNALKTGLAPILFMKMGINLSNLHTLAWSIKAPCLWQSL